MSYETIYRGEVLYVCLGLCGRQVEEQIKLLDVV